MDCVSLRRGLCSRWGRIGAHAGELHNDSPDEGGIVDQVAFPQAPWILNKPVQPLKPCSLDPCRAIAKLPSVIIECRTYANHEWNIESAGILSHESFLLRRAQAYPYDVRPGLRNLRSHFVFFMRGKGSEGRCICADDLQSWKSIAQRFSQQVCYAGLAAVEEIAVASLHGEAADRGHEVRPKDAVHLPKTLKPAHPCHRHSVGQADHRVIQNVEVLGIMLRFHYTVYTSDAYVAGATGVDPLLGEADGEIHVDG